MKVTVADCLKLDTFRNAELVAGKAKTSNEVKTVTPLEIFSPDDMELYQGDDMTIILTGFLLDRQGAEKTGQRSQSCRR